VENLYKVGGSLKRLKSAETLLWQGQIAEAQALFNNCRGKQVQNFVAYPQHHFSLSTTAITRLNNCVLLVLEQSSPQLNRSSWDENFWRTVEC